jgi:hypothetical protein
MATATPFGTLRQHSDKELIDLHDQLVQSAGHAATPTYYLEELAHRRAERQAWTLTWLTVAIAVLTVSNVVLIAIDVL